MHGTQGLDILCYIILIFVCMCTAVGAGVTGNVCLKAGRTAAVISGAVMKKY